MKEIGKYMAIAGILAIALNFANRVPRVLMWIYAWGDTVAWGIKIGLIVVGAILFFTAKEKKQV